MFESVAERLKDARKVVFVTGAGISQESGIPTFRGKDGLWRNHDAMKLATIDAFFKDPKLVWEWYNERRTNIFAASPNDGHRAVADFEEMAEVVILTQNIDGLHKRAGSSNVLELHGSIVKIKCTVCDFNEEVVEMFSRVPPVCTCGNILRPDVVWFGETLPQDVWMQAVAHADSCDVMVIVGTSLVVSPANTLPMYARQNNAVLIEINPEETEMSAGMDISVRDTAVHALPKMVSFARRLRSRH